METLTQTDKSFALGRQAELHMKQVSNQAKNAVSDLENAKNLKAIDAAAQEFEAVFLSEMIKPIFEELKSDPMFGGGQGEEVFQGMMVQEYGKLMSERGGVGIAEHVKAEMIRIQEATQQGKIQRTAANSNTSTNTQSAQSTENETNAIIDAISSTAENGVSHGQ